jgi:hypothetical protein
LTKDEFADLMYRSFGDDIDRETWEGIFDELAEEFSTIDGSAT